MSAAEIRAWLDEHGTGLRPGPMEQALLAVLDECDYAPRTPTAQRLAAGVRHRIADALGID